MQVSKIPTKFIINQHIKGTKIAELTFKSTHFLVTLFIKIIFLKDKLKLLIKMSR